MTTNAAEWLMAGATVVTGVFVAYQSLLFRESLESPFEANLQDRQIAACATAIQNKGALIFVDSIIEGSNWAKAFDPTENLRSEGNELFDEEMLVEPLVDSQITGIAGLLGLRSSIDTSSEASRSFRSALAELRVYSSDQTKLEIEAVEESVFTLQTLRFSKLSPSEMGGEALLPTLDDLFLPIEAKCRAIMLGESKGLI